MSDDGTRSGEGWTRQEGQPQEGSGQEQVDCEVCGQSESWHYNKNIVHRFTPRGTPVDTRQFDRKRSRRVPPDDDSSRRHPVAYGAAQTPQTAAPFDPVLRMALIDAGIITVEQLREAEDKISMFTQLVTSDPRLRGPGTDG